MSLSDLMSETLASLASNKVRSGLTILGIVVGIASVIVMVAIGQGSQASIESSIQSAGSNLLTVSPGSSQEGMVRGASGSADTLTTEDAEAIESLGEVAGVAPEANSMAQLVAGDANSNARVIGTTPSYADVKSLSLGTGSFLSERDQKAAAKVAVLGATTAEELFGDASSAIGKTMRVGGIAFRVVGVTQTKGGNSFFSSDQAVYVPLSTLQAYLTGSEGLSSINVQAVDAESMELASGSITSLLLSRHDIDDVDEADFQVQSQEDILETASTITGTMTVLLASIAGISLVVGGIGIMNMMLTTVTERTREIGLRKAVGATRSAVTAQFLSEAIALTLTGGIVGVGLGWLAAWAVAAFSSISTEVSVTSVLLAAGVCAGIGLVFGYYPARRAAGLNPIEALRYQ